MMLFVVTLSAVFVYFDATKNKIGKLPDNKGFLNMSAGMWSFGVLLLWILIFPLYLIKRSSLIGIAKENPQDVSLRGAKLGFLSVVCALSFVTGLASLGGFSSISNNIANSSQNAAYTRDEFRSLLMSKTAEEVISMVGRPSQTQEAGPLAYWYFESTTYDPVTNSVDLMVQVSFIDGKVEMVSFN